MSNHDQPIHILLIEDDPDDVVLFIQNLRQAGGSDGQFRVVCVHSLDEGMGRLLGGDVDIVVLDLSLPDGWGLETLAKLQSRMPDIPIVVLTASNDESQAVEALRRGVQDYLIKGQVNSLILPRTIRYAIERHRFRKELYEISIQLRQANEKLEKLVLLDPLTGLLNRRGLQDALSHEIQWVKREESELLALILDLDDFKHINDSFGHAVGDVVLKEVAENLKQALRVTDYIARIGGDEFLVLMPQTRKAEGMRVAEKIRLSISGHPISLSIKDVFKITASLGLVAIEDSTVSVDDLLARTHSVLQKSKRSGKNKVSYDPDKKEDADADLYSISRILTELKENDCYRVVKQPIFDLVREVPVGYEFLSRTSIEGFEMPDDFFRMCLENNILTFVDHQCLKHCVNAGSALSAHFRRHLNLFPSTMIDIPVQHLINALPDKSRDTYCIELSEQQIIGDPSYLVESVNALKKSGVLIAIDDVGFGRSCLESLILLEPDIVKIDKRCVNGISQNPWRRCSLERLLKVTAALGSEVVAEGIERREDLELLKVLGVRYGQGFLLGRPA